MTKKCGIILSTILIAIAFACVVAYGRLPRVYQPSFALIHGWRIEFYQIILIIVTMLCAIGLLVIRLICRQMKSKGFKLTTGIEITLLAVVVILCSGHLLVNGASYHLTPYATSPDGAHVLYQAGGDEDVFGNVSGYMHYAQTEGAYRYSRVFYCDDADYVPQIEWYKDGFLVRCQTGQGEVVSPESDQSSSFAHEKREDGYFFYYSKKED